MSWSYFSPVEIIFKTGGVTEIKNIARAKGFKRGVLICSPYFIDSGLVEKIKFDADGLIVEIFSDITPNPKVDEAQRCVDLLRSVNADFAVAVGGGSAIDCAKAACAIAKNSDDVAYYHLNSAALSGESIPLIAVPTTAGTGSEVTSVAVLTDESKKIKVPISHPSLYPVTALIDPALTISSPPQLTASAGFDVLSHALEGFWSVHHQPICDALALHSATLVFNWLKTAYENGDNIVAREKMCEASVVAGLAFALPKTAAVHAISYPLTNIYDMPHGEACAFTLDSVCEINAKAEGGRLDDFARKIGFSDAKAMAHEIADMKKQTRTRSTLSSVGIEIEDLPKLVSLCKHPNLDNNPIKLDEKALMELFKSKI